MRTRHERLVHYLECVSVAAGRAGRARTIARRHEEFVLQASPRYRALHESQAAIHRQSEQRHLAAVALYTRHVCRMNESMSGRVPIEDPSIPRFIDTLAALVRSASVCVDLRSSTGHDVVVASDSTARAAHECESLVGEGPVHASALEGPLVATGGEIQTRWGLYGAVVESLGVESVATVPLRVSEVTLGSMTAFGTSAHPIEARLEELCTIGDAVVDVLVAEVENPRSDAGGLIQSADFGAIVHQAAGIVSVQYGCAIADALALLRAHAFSVESDLGSIAEAVVAGDLRFDRP